VRLRIQEGLIQLGIFALVAGAREAGDDFVALMPECIDGRLFLRFKPGLIQPMQPRLGLNQEKAVDNGEQRGDAGQQHIAKGNLAGRVKSEEPLNNQQKRNGQIEHRDLTLQGLVCKFEIFRGTEDMRLKLAFADIDVLKVFLKGHGTVKLA